MALSVEGVSKRYGAVRALRNVTARFEPGRIHAVLGENGAGKSTLMGVLSGFIVPDEGTVQLHGEPVPVGKPFACKHCGIEMIHQHFTLVPEFTVEENLALARVDRLMRPANTVSLAEPALAIAREAGWEVDPKAKVRTLPVGVQQRIEILKALASDARVLIFDEPTAVLSAEEVADLFRVLRRLRDQGKIVVLIAHKLSEILDVADEVTVLRRGEKVGSGPLSQFDQTSLAELMVGELPAGLSAGSTKASTPGLTIQNLVVRGDRGEESVRGVSFEVRRGEILGIGGVDGNGQTELAEAMAGVRTPSAGSVNWAEGEPRIGYVPQDRQVDGLALTMSLSDNFLIAGYRHPDLVSGPFLRPRRIAAWARDLVSRFGIRADGIDVRAATLSGGNQQKVVVSRTLEESPDLLVVANPTRGLDVKASAYVHQVLRDARDRGAAVVLFSTDLDELAAIADRNLFMSRGELREAAGSTSLVGGP